MYVRLNKLDEHIAIKAKFFKVGKNCKVSLGKACAPPFRSIVLGFIQCL